MGGEDKYMRELSLHILDIVQNSIQAQATEVQIRVNISTERDELLIEIEDNGYGMSKETAERVLDPFVTTRTTRRVGLGLPLFKAAAERCNGELVLHSEEGRGTLVQVRFRFSHIDRAPMGDIIATLTTLIQGSPDVDFIYDHWYDGESYLLSTHPLRQELEGVPLNHPLVLDYVANDLRDGLVGLLTGV
jgi:anti-sigma regulatory factor (Ser/Thr protein kinase)